MAEACYCLQSRQTKQETRGETRCVSVSVRKCLEVSMTKRLFLWQRRRRPCWRLLTRTWEEEGVCVCMSFQRSPSCRCTSSSPHNSRPRRGRGAYTPLARTAFPFLSGAFGNVCNRSIRFPWGARNTNTRLVCVQAGPNLSLHLHRSGLLVSMHIVHMSGLLVRMHIVHRSGLLVSCTYSSHVWSTSPHAHT